MWSRIRQLLAAPVFEDEEKTRVARLLNTVLLTFCVAVLLVAASIPVLYGLPASPEEVFTLLSGVIMGIAAIGLLLLARRGHVRLAAIVLLLLLWAIITYWVCGVAGVSSDTSPLVYAFVIALAGLLLGVRAAINLTLASVVAVLAAYLLEYSGLLTVPESPLTIMDPIMTAVPLVLIGLLLRHAVDSISRALERARSNERAQIEANRELEAMRASLEDQVAERTRNLERRSMQLQGAVEVSRAATSILDPERLIWELVELIQDRFDLYHAGLCLLDSTRRWAEYRAGAGEAGRALAAEGFRLEVGGPSMIGWCTLHGETRVAQDISAEMSRVDHPLVPATRSEAALPLTARGQVIGALSVQSDQPDAFDPDTVAALQTMADQVAVALDNARLFTESQEALEATRRAYGELSRQAWANLLQARADWGYSYMRQSVAPAGGNWSTEMRQAAQMGQAVQGDAAEGPSLALPLRVRDQVVGALGFYKSAPDEPWTMEEKALLETLVGQLGVALESAQLFEETQRRAAREQAIRQVTERMRAAVDVEAILQTTVAELTTALGVPRAYVRLGTETRLEPSERTAHQTGLPAESPGHGEGSPGLTRPDEPAPADPQPSGEEGDD
jgi:GAF domain-containing protein